MKRAEPPDALLDHRSEPGPRAVLSDWLEEIGRNLRWLPLADDADDAADDAADADADADDAADADDDADADADDAAADDDGAAAADDGDYADYDAADYDDAADADDDGDYADYADADDAADDDGARKHRKNITTYLDGAPHMHTGLVLLKFPRTGYYGRGLTLVGWCRRREGDTWELVGASPVWRRSGAVVPLAQLAAEGVSKHKGHSLGYESKLPEPFHVLIPRRWVPCVESAWPEKPKPEGWGE